jgi:glycosyltransferase involved in cell wall biosynthesis
MGVWATESGWLATVAAKRLGLPSLVHLAGGELVWLPDIRYGNQGRGLSRLLVRRCLRNATLLTVPSGPMHRALLKYPGIHPGKVKPWALGVDTQMFKPRNDKPTSDVRPFTFITAGSLIPVKNHTWLIRAMEDWAEIASHQTPVRLTVAGGGPLLPDLRALAHRLNLEGYVEFLGEVPHDDLPRLYADADCFLLASRHEAQCMAALEAMACGLPWIAPPVGALADLAQPAPGQSPSGIPLKDRSLSSLVYALQTMLDATPEQRAAWGQSSRHQVLENYDLQTQTARLLAMLESII